MSQDFVCASQSSDPFVLHVVQTNQTDPFLPPVDDGFLHIFLVPMEPEWISIQRIDAYCALYDFDKNRRLYSPCHHTFGQRTVDEVDGFQVELVHVLSFNRNPRPRSELEQPRKPSHCAGSYHQLARNEYGI